MLLAIFLKDLIHIGCLNIVDAKGRNYRFEGQHEGPEFTVRLHDRALHWKLFFNPLLHFGEGVMDGTITVEDGELYDLLDLISNIPHGNSSWSNLSVERSW